MAQSITLPPPLYLLVVLVLAIYYIFPAYVANAIPVLAGGGTPIDCNRTFRDGRRIFGPGKTYRGFIAGVIMGGVTGLVQNILNPWLITVVTEAIVLQPSELSLFETSGLLGVVLGFGALLGDLVASFIKRRLNMERGDPAPGLDQLDFLTGAIVLSYPLHPLALPYILLLIVATPVIHLLTNILGFLLKLKKEPW